MAVFSISYDLIKRKDYDLFWTELERLGARQYLHSEWAVRRPDAVTALALRDHLRQFIDPDDRLFVARLDTTDWASWKTLLDMNEL